jgi:hypothetical protein
MIRLAGKKSASQGRIFSMGLFPLKYQLLTILSGRERRTTQMHLH